MVRPEGGRRRRAEPTTRTVDSTVRGRRSSGVAGRGPRRRQRHRLRCLRRRQGRARSSAGIGPPGDRRQLVRRPGRPRPRGPRRSSPAGRPSGRDEVVLDAATAGEAGYVIGEHGPHRHRRPTGARSTPTLVGIADFPEGGSLNGATLTAFDTRTAQELFLDGKDAFTDVWVTAEPTASRQEELRDAGAPSAARRRRGRHRRRGGRRGGQRPARGDLVPDHLPADLRRHLAGRRRLPDRQHVLDPGRPAQPRARPAARPRRLASARSPARCCWRRSSSACSARRSASGWACCWPSASGALFAQLRARPVRAAAGLRAAHRRWRRTPWASSSPWPRPGSRPGGPPGSRRSRRCATTSRCRRRRCAAGCWSGSC